MKARTLFRCAAIRVLLVSAVLFVQPVTPAAAQLIEVIEVAPGIHMLHGPSISGNIGVASGADRTLVIDTSFAVLTPLIRSTIAGFAQKPVSLVLNTHYHPDHTGGNENFGASGALIIAHDNTRLRLNPAPLNREAGTRRDALADPSLPIVTFDNTATLHLNDEEIQVFHVASAHTDGDAIVFFRNANVFHMGDVFYNFTFPLIDTAAGGTIEGIIAAVDRVLAIANDETRIIPGHGPLSDRAGLAAYRLMLETVRERVRIAMAEGSTLEEIAALRPTADFDAQWGGGVVSAEEFVAMVYRSMQ